MSEQEKNEFWEQFKNQEHPAYEYEVSEDGTVATKDHINPDHYKRGGLEAIDVMEAFSTEAEFLGHCRLTAIKYLLRYGHKDNNLRELKKAQWYVNRMVTTVEKKNGKS